MASLMDHSIVGSVGMLIFYVYGDRLLNSETWLPAFLRTVSSWKVSKAQERPEVLSRMAAKREQVLKDIAGVWSLMIESFWLPYFALVNLNSYGDFLQVPCFLSGSIAVPALQQVARPDVKLTPSVMQKCTVSLSIAILLSSVLFPRDLMPILYVARIMVGTFATDVRIVTKTNILLTPFYVLSNWAQKEMQESDAPHLILWFMIMAEGFFVCITSLILATLYEKEYQLAAATLELEEKVQEVKQAERSGVAAQRLLAVTCDASARLTGELRIAQPSPSLADLMMCNFSKHSNFLEGVSFLRYVDASDHQRLQGFIEESAQASTPPRSIHLQMKDSGGITFKAELFHVSVPSLSSEEPEHLIGICQENTERALVQEGSSLAEALVPDMRHILGYGVDLQAPRERSAEKKKPSVGSPSLSGSRQESENSHSSKATSQSHHLVRLRMLENVQVVVDAQSDDLTIRSLSMSFAPMDNCPEEAMPKLLEWIKPNYRSAVNNWVQAHANSYVSEKPCEEEQKPLRGIKLLSPMQSAKTLLVGEVMSGGFMEQPGTNASGSSEGVLLMTMDMKQIFAH